MSDSMAARSLVANSRASSTEMLTDAEEIVAWPVPPDELDDKTGDSNASEIWTLEEWLMPEMRPMIL